MSEFGGEPGSVGAVSPGLSGTSGMRYGAAALLAKHDGTRPASYIANRSTFLNVPSCTMNPSRSRAVFSACGLSCPFGFRTVPLVIRLLSHTYSETVCRIPYELSRERFWSRRVAAGY